MLTQLFNAETMLNQLSHTGQGVSHHFEKWFTLFFQLSTNMHWTYAICRLWGWGMLGILCAKVDSHCPHRVYGPAYILIQTFLGKTIRWWCKCTGNSCVTSIEHIFYQGTCTQCQFAILPDLWGKNFFGDSVCIYKAWRRVSSPSVTSSWCHYCFNPYTEPFIMRWKY